jgi:predicted phosphodiesterase
VGLRIEQPEVFGVTESSVALSFRVVDEQGAVDAPAWVRVDGRLVAVSAGSAGTRALRIDGLEPGAGVRIEIEAEPGAPAQHDEGFPETVRTLPAPRARQVASFATLNDLHFGEPRFGGQPRGGGEFGPPTPEYPEVRADDTDVPYWRFMNEDAIAEIDASGVDAVVIKGDIADSGLPEQFEAAREAFARLRMPHHAFLGNHDYYGMHQGLEVDGYALLGQAPLPRVVGLGGWQLVLLDTVEPGHHHGVLDGDRLAWLSRALDETRDDGRPTLVFTHHQPVPPEQRDSYPNTIGVVPEHSLELYDLLGRHPQVRAVLIGHTHRNRVRRHPAAGAVPFVEVNCTKDYPGGWAHYRLFEDGSFRQEVRRTSSGRALAHSTRCRDLFKGFYRVFSLGTLGERSFALPESNDL